MLIITKKGEMIMNENTVVITRHPALIEYLKEIGLIEGDVNILPHATPDEVRNKDVIGVLPHSLSCLTNTYTEVPIFVPPELRGQELTLEQIREYAQEPATYKIERL